MSWGDHDVDLIRKKLNTEDRPKQKVSKEQALFLTHKEDNEKKNLGYRDRDWFQLGWDEANKNKVVDKVCYKNNFAKNLKIIRVATGFTMEELHNQSGVAIQTIGKYEAGDTEPSISNLLKLAESLSVSIYYLVSAELKLEVKQIE